MGWIERQLNGHVVGCCKLCKLGIDADPWRPDWNGLEWAQHFAMHQSTLQPNLTQLSQRQSD
jgi:hypothetical protein